MTHYNNLNMDLREYSKNSREYETSLSDIMKKMVEYIILTLIYV